MPINDGKLVGGHALGWVSSGRLRLEGWAGTAFRFPKSRTALIENPAKGPLWPYLKDIDIYRCPRGREGHALTYAAVVSANNMMCPEGTYVDMWMGRELTRPGVRVGSTVLKLTRLTDIVSPGPAARAVFVDTGQTPGSSGLYVNYLCPLWDWGSPPPIQHASGATFSMADGHAEYWKWKGSETVELPRKEIPAASSTGTVLADGDYEPRTEDGLYDLQRLQRATWGRLGYSTEKETP